MASAAIDAIARCVADVIVGSAVDASVDASEEALPRFGRRHPRALRFARLVGGAFLVLVGLWEAVLSMVVFVVAYSGEGLWVLFLPLPFSMGVGATIWGLQMMRRGWASRGVVSADVTDSNFPPQVSHRGPTNSDEPRVGAPTARWLRTVFIFVLWIAGSVIAILAGVPDGYAMLLGWLLPITAYLVCRHRRAAGRY